MPVHRSGQGAVSAGICIIDYGMQSLLLANLEGISTRQRVNVWMKRRWENYAVPPNRLTGETDKPQLEARGSETHPPVVINN